MINVRTAVQWFPPPEKADGTPRGHSPIPNVVYIAARRVNAPERGIAFNQPGGWFAQTWLGNIQLATGDWVVTCTSGNVYVIKQADYQPWAGDFRAPWQVKVLRFLRKWGIV